MFTTAGIDSHPHDDSTQSLVSLATTLFAVATLITIVWIALGVLLVGF